MPHDVFVSHSKDDRLTAYALCNKLESAGIRCWIGPRDVEPGVDWGAAIINAIGGCRVMVLIFSLKANSSRHVHREVQRAFDKDLTVIPFRVEDVEPTGTLEYYLSSVHWLDAITPPLEEHLEAVVRRVKALLLPPSVLESATRLAAENMPTLPQTVSKPKAVKLRSPSAAPETQIHAPADPPISPPPLPPPPLPSRKPVSVATKSSLVPLEQIVRRIGFVVPSDLFLRLALSVFAKRRDGEKLPPQSIVAAGAWLLIIVCLILLLISFIVDAGQSSKDKQKSREGHERFIRR